MIGSGGRFVILRRGARLVRERPVVGIGLLVLALLAMWTLVFRPSGLESPVPPSAPKAEKPGPAPGLLSPEVPLHSEVVQLRKDVQALRETIEALQREGPAGRGLPPAVPGVPTLPPGAGSGFGALLPPGALRVPPAPLAPRPAVPEPLPPAGRGDASLVPAPARLTRFKIAEVQPPPAPPVAPVRSVHLPAGAFIGVTLLSGVYAPVKNSQPLPVLVHFNELAHAPNAARVPVDRCWAVAKAVGDITSARAIMQLDQISCTLPDGRAFSAPVSGWINGPDGVLGIPGEVIEHTGPFLAKAALAGFIQGGAAGLSQAEATVTTTPLGGSQTIVSGNTGQFAALQGLSSTAKRMADFYAAQLEALVPAVFVKAGGRGAAVIQNGVTIDGLPVHAVRGASPWKSLD